ncbi:MAG: phosphoribosylanthranilate isomerase, partial [Gemmatimonadaceae bacterium]
RVLGGSTDIRAEPFPMLIKICGLTRALDAELAESLGANFLGAIMAGGPRNLDVVRAREVLGPRRHTVRRVAVFATQARTEIADIAHQLALDVVQLHGDHSVEDIYWLKANSGAEVWPVIRIAGTVLPEVTEVAAQAAGAVLLDAKVVGQLGGTGVALDWAELRRDVRRLRERVPGVQLILAGGLRSTNVRQAREMLTPEIVDVSSGVESAPGIKDAAGLRAFFKAVRATP